MILASVSVLFILLMQGFAPTCFGDAELPKWKVGDKWRYEPTTVNITANFTIEVSELTTVNVNGTNYEVYIVKTRSDLIVPDANLTELIDHYILRGNLGIVKRNTTHIAPEEEIQTAVTTYNPPRMDYHFPLVIGKSWFSNFTESMYNKDWGYYNTTKSVRYTVVGIESVTVKAGTFECYKIEINEGGGGFVYTWYSPEVNNMVKTTGGTEGLIFPMELTYSTYLEKENEGFNLFAMPWVLLLIIIPIIIVILVVWLVVKRKGKKEI